MLSLRIGNKSLVEEIVIEGSYQDEIRIEKIKETYLFESDIQDIKNEKKNSRQNELVRENETVLIDEITRKSDSQSNKNSGQLQIKNKQSREPNNRFETNFSNLFNALLRSNNKEAEKNENRKPISDVTIIGRLIPQFSGSLFTQSTTISEEMPFDLSDLKKESKQHNRGLEFATGFHFITENLTSTAVNGIGNSYISTYEDRYQPLFSLTQSIAFRQNISKRISFSLGLEYWHQEKQHTKTKLIENRVLEENPEAYVITSTSGNTLLSGETYAIASNNKTTYSRVTSTVISVPMSIGITIVTYNKLDLSFHSELALGYMTSYKGSFLDASANDVTLNKNNYGDYNPTTYILKSRLSFRADYSLNKNWNIFIEPTIRKSVTNVFRQAMPVVRKDLSYGLQLGLSYNLNEQKEAF